ncbi:E3 ubiquitin-protein ligase ORTHRUS 2-like isoform X2 [Amaranthus tricolor]|uniref:E3 ubiquitin-protein ligase ORTHRUS 2-like isoform X2 n=1 Tax=Amaranthus tricolor TaxID=29722 RepID=UPI0025826E94|nr:E3 ubiquitin-protein ligase ORTHRUS 2-like isoform X2 [Amaranthus tricolor]
MFSPRFKSVAAMAGWDEEALILASLVVEDTPERNLKNKKRSDLCFNSPPTSSRRKRRRARPDSIPIPILNLDEDEDFVDTNKKAEKGKSDSPKKIEEKSKEEEKEKTACSSSSTLDCMDRLRDELSCAICLEICYEPSTTPCGHSFCKKCLKAAADKCGKKCPKCRQLISNGRSCNINTVLWNTIQLLFPKEVESRKEAAAASLNSRTTDDRRNTSERTSSLSNRSNNNSNRYMTRRLRPLRSEDAGLSSRRGVPDQDEDAALALRLQREEFMEIYRGSSLARDNLRAMARRAMNLARNYRAV